LEGAIDIVPLRYYEDKYQKELITTDPELAKQFVAETKVDSLAVSIGNQSGKLKSEIPLDIPLLTKINSVVSELPLVLHGGSYLSDETIMTCIQNGVSKINVNTEVRLAYSTTLKKNLEQNPDEYAPYRLLTGARESMEKVILSKINLFQGNHGSL
jgi:fructose-bisphosphate aldolase class II